MLPLYLDLSTLKAKKLWVTGVTPPKIKLLFSSPKTIFWNWPKTVDEGDLPFYPGS